MSRSQRIPIIAICWNPSRSGSVTPTICSTPRSTSRFVRARTAASDTPRSDAIWVNGRRPSCWRCSMIRLSSGDTSSAPRPDEARRPFRPFRVMRDSPSVGGILATAPVPGNRRFHGPRASRARRADHARSSSVRTAPTAWIESVVIGSRTSWTWSMPWPANSRRTSAMAAGEPSSGAGGSVA